MASVAHPRRQPAILELSPHNVSMWTWLTTVDHKRIGILYLVTGGVFFALAGLEAVLMRTQLIHARNDFLQPDFYNAMFTVHGTTMMFLAVIPILFGFANHVLPLQIGAREKRPPRTSAICPKWS